jgi:hypothetical protein
MAIYSIVGGGREAGTAVENRRGTIETPLPLSRSPVNTRKLEANDLPGVRRFSEPVEICLSGI